MDYIFKTINKINTFDYDFLYSIENRLNEGITYDEAIYFLNWLISRISLNLPYNFKYAAFCGDASELAVSILNKLEVQNYTFDMKPIVTGEKRGGLHTLTLVTIKVIQFNEVVTKGFILDPTFGQFCITERCQKDGWFLRNGWNVQLPPDPGYFLSLTPEGVIFGTKILNDGFFEFTEENFKLYCDAFLLSNKDNPILSHNISKTDYINAIYIYEWQLGNPSFTNDIRIPSEIKKQNLGKDLSMLENHFKI